MTVPASQDESARIRLLRELRILDTQEEPAFEALVRLAARQTGCAVGALSFVDGRRQWFKARVGTALRETPLASALCARAILSSDVTVIDDASADPAFAGNPLLAGPTPLRFYAAAPVSVEGVCLGTVCCLDPLPRRLDGHALAGLRDLAVLAGELLQARLRDQRSRLQEARVRSASRTASDWLWETDAAGRLTWLSDDLSLRKSPAPPLVVGEHWLKPYEGESQQHAGEWQRVQQAMQRHEPFTKVLTACRVGDAVMTISSNAHPVFDSTGAFMGYRGASRDVTAAEHAKRAAEQALARQQAEVVESRGQLAAALNAIPDLWFICDESTLYLESNTPDHPMLTRPFASLKGRPVRDILPGDAGLTRERLIKEALHTGAMTRHEHQVSFNGGPLRSFEARMMPMPGRRVLTLVRDLTEMRSLERDVRLMQHVLEAESAMPFVVVDALAPDQPVVFANRAFERLTGYTRAEVLGQNCRFLQGTMRNQPARATLRHALAHGQPCNVLLENQRKDGSFFTNKLHIAPVHDLSGQLVQYLGVLNDVTAEAKAADKLRVSEEMYRAVASTISEGLLVVMPDRMIVAANPAGCHILGADYAELLGAPGPWPFAFCEVDGQPFAPEDDPIGQVLATGRPMQGGMFTVRRRDGSHRWLDLSCHPLRVPTGSNGLPVLAAFRDVTAQHFAEQQLALSEQRWKFALEGGSQGVWDWNAGDDGIYVSESAKALFGIAPDDRDQYMADWMTRIHPGDVERAKDELRAHLRGDTPLYSVECRTRHNRGHYIMVLHRGKVVRRDERGRAVRMVGTVMDVTAQRAAELALRDKQAALLASEAKTEFLSRMSHEMRTPLNAVIGFSQLLLGRPGEADTQQVREYADHVLRAGQHLLALINDVLDLQRVEEGRLTLQPDDVALDVMARRVIDLLSPAAEQRGVVFENRLPEGLTVRADERHLRQVLLNLASNAVKYNRPAGVVRWSAELLPLQGLVRLSIEDNGAGLSASQIERLFQPFDRLGRETSSIEGTGLGLIIARSLTVAMGGSLKLQSEKGVGTRAIVELPIGEGEAQATAALPLDMGVPAGTSGEAAVLRMLYVEDNRINAILFEQALQLRRGIELRLAEDADEALDIVREWLPDVLVLDAHLPGMNGFELLQTMRVLPGMERVPAFMCSADAMPADFERATAAGFVGYWPKPIDIAGILRDLDGLRQRALS